MGLINMVLVVSFVVLLVSLYGLGLFQECVFGMGFLMASHERGEYGRGSKTK